MKRNYFLSLFAVLMLVPFGMKAQFDAGDLAALDSIRINNFAAGNMLNWGTEPNPALWLGVTWDGNNPRRVVELNLHEYGSAAGSSNNGYGNGDHGHSLSMHVFTATNMTSTLMGVADFSAFTELKFLCVSSQDNLTGVNVLGLNNLTHFMCGSTGLLSLDLSNSPSLQHISGYGVRDITYLNLSNCPNLQQVRLTSGGGTLDTAIFTGSDNITFLNLRGQFSNTAYTQSLDFTNMVDLYKFQGDGGNLTSLVGLDNCNKLVQLLIDDNKINGSIDLSKLDGVNLEKLDASGNKLDSILNWNTVTSGRIQEFSVNNNELTLDNATQIFNELSSTDTASKDRKKMMR